MFPSLHFAFLFLPPFLPSSFLFSSSSNNGSLRHMAHMVPERRLIIPTWSLFLSFAYSTLRKLPTSTPSAVGIDAQAAWHPSLPFAYYFLPSSFLLADLPFFFPRTMEVWGIGHIWCRKGGSSYLPTWFLSLSHPYSRLRKLPTHRRSSLRIRILLHPQFGISKQPRTLKLSIDTVDNIEWLMRHRIRIRIPLPAPPRHASGRNRHATPSYVPIEFQQSASVPLSSHLPPLTFTFHHSHHSPLGERRKAKGEKAERRKGGKYLPTYLPRQSKGKQRTSRAPWAPSITHSLQPYFFFWHFASWITIKITIRTLR